MAILRVALALLFAFFLTTVAVAEGQRVILVLDASGSMWGQISGTAKMDIAKDVVGKVVGSWKPEDEIGLVAYGHRKKGACDDIETLIEPGAFNAQKFMSSVKALTAKGKTPMTQAVRQAAEALKYTEKQATVILVSDGIETCDPNPCAVAEELEKLGIGLTVHTVGFGLDDKGAVAQLKCLAEKTGGIAVLAENADELERALKQTVEAKIEEPTPPAEPVNTLDLTGHVVMAEGVELPAPFDAPSWVFHRSQNGEKGKYISTEFGVNLKTDMTVAGDILAIVKSDHAEVVVAFKHLEGQPTVVPVNMNVGVVQFKGMMDESTALPDKGPTWVFYGADGTYYATSFGGAPKNLFNAGDYKAKLQMGSAEIETAFSVVAGKTTDVVVTLGSGIVRVSATYSDGGEATSEGTTIELRKPADISGEKKWIATEYGNDKTFQVPAGDYVLIVKLNIAEAEMPLNVVAGKEISAKVNLNAGFVAVKAPSATRIEILSGALALDGKRKWLGTEYGEVLNYAANTGSYHVIAYGAEDVVVGEKDVVVEAGKRAEVILP